MRQIERPLARTTPAGTRHILEKLLAHPSATRIARRHEVGRDCLGSFPARLAATAVEALHVFCCGLIRIRAPLRCLDAVLREDIAAVPGCQCVTSSESGCRSSLPICRSSSRTWKAASTISESHCLPAPSRKIESSFSSGIPLRYGRSLDIASIESATATMRARNGVSSPFSPAG